MFYQLSGGEAVFWQPLHTMFYEVDGKLAHFSILDRCEQALKAHVGNCVDRVDPLAFFVPVDSGGCALFKQRLRRWTEKGMVLGERVCFGPGLINSVWHNWNFASKHLQGHATDHPNVDGGVEGPSQKDFWRTECLGAAHTCRSIAHVVLGNPDRFAQVVQLREAEAVFGDDERLGFRDWVLVAILAVVDLASLRVLLELVHILFEEITGKAEQNVVELYVCVDEETLGVQEVESLEGVHQDFLGKGDGKVA